ncbi:MAG: type II CRISPR RNA-guided endonuclease Cas9, partial [[Eubacterium] siraeum]|nr:type II CRISPR RNA-guided endonuclease Cas9 [[Eubacterium] siraeum]
MTKDYYLGFDLGTNSAGWAVTDLEYNLKKFKGNLMWGVMLFDEAKHADERRALRTARRRLNRRNQRVQLLQELLAPEIVKKDPHFFERLRESKLFPEDSEHRTHNIYFDDENYTDKDYFNDYPTIHHLINELMTDEKPHDVRLVYLACAYILKHRGHFLIELDSDNIDEVRNFAPIYEKFTAWFENIAQADLPFECSHKNFGDVLKKKIGITAKEKEFKELLFGGKTPKQDNSEEFPVNISKLFKLICGGKVKLSEIFKNESYKDLKNDSICVASAEFDDILEEIYSRLEEGDGELLKTVKAMHDWSLLEDILMGYSSISEAKISVYNEHKRNLTELKRLISHYLSAKEYKEIFKDAGDKDNYVCYVQNLKSLKKGIYPKKKCSQEDFCKFVGKYLDKISPETSDGEIYKEIKEKADNKTLCPKQVTSDNRVIPYQLYYAELKRILENASKYLNILDKSDQYGSVKDKILSIMQFRIPYYVGPLVKFNGKNCHAWLEKKADGKIYPWNFEEIVDLDKSEDAFIRRMTCKCTYIAGEDVLPKNSLLYAKYTVLNELNNLSVDGKRISAEDKQGIYNRYFLEQKTKVTKKKIKDFLISKGSMTKEQALSGVDDVLKSSLKPYHDFKRLLTAGVLTENDAEKIIERITATTDRKRLQVWLKENYGSLSDEDIAYISKLKYSDYGRLSKKLLDGICEIDSDTGEASDCTVISAMWEKQQNLMELLSEKYGFAAFIEELNNEYYGKNPKTLTEKLEDWYVPTAARRTIIRALDIAKEIKPIMQGEPKKIFI